MRELFGVMAASGATAGIVVTSGAFTSEATAFAEGRNVTLLDGPRLIALIGPVQEDRAEVRVETPVPDCPRCSKPMVRRVVKQGANAGSEFWGCTAYPGCRGTRPLA